MIRVIINGRSHRLGLRQWRKLVPIKELDLLVNQGTLEADK
jgi:hypothetical protein